MTDLTSNQIKYHVRLTRKEELHYPAYDATALTALNTCPTWGLVTYVLHRRFSGCGRALALEAGSALHECFSAVRLWQLKHVQNKAALADRRFAELFPNAERRAAMLQRQSQAGLSDKQKLIHFCVQALYTSGYYDDPDDSKRTLANMEQALLYYIERWRPERYPVYVNEEQSFCGIELPFDLMITRDDGEGPKPWVRYTGRIDGLHTDDEVPILEENKTAWRLNDAWRMSFDMSHQVTGYLCAASVLSGLRVFKGIIIGLTIPLPRSITDGLDYVHVSRQGYHFQRWLDWIVHTDDIRRMTFNDPTLAAKYTHSCNRYFRPCSLIPFCTADNDEQRNMLEQMEQHQWSPLDE